MLNRANYKAQLIEALRLNPVVALIGTRQIGKTTLARELLSEQASTYFDLEDPTVAALMENPMSALDNLNGLVVIDEAQRAPQIFPALRVLADRSDGATRFLILGSASPSLTRQASESLAGRIAIIEMHGLSIKETGVSQPDRLWLRGGFPRAFLAESDHVSFRWRTDFIRTFLEQDLSNLGFGMAPAKMRRFWTMLAHYNGQVWNASEVAASMGIAPNSSRNYLDALEQTFMVRQLLPWHANVKKRLVKTPKLYFRDSGLFHVLLHIENQQQLLTHPKLGASWEAFALEQILTTLQTRDAYFYAAHSGMELDLYLPNQGNLGIEFKRQDAPKITRSMREAIKDLNLKELWIIYPGHREYELEKGIWAKPLNSIC